MEVRTLTSNIQKMIIFLLVMAAIVATIKLVDWIIERMKKKKANAKHVHAQSNMSS